MKNIVFIWWWNWQSNILKWINETIWDNKYNIISIVSMSDDGRTTWLLMNLYFSRFQKHLSPPWDLRRCLFALSNSLYKNEFSKSLEFEIQNSEKFINEVSIKDLFEIGLNWNYDFLNFLYKNFSEILDYKLDINSSINWHKIWNLIMAILYHNFWDYNRMVNYMEKLLESIWKVIPITISRAYIQAKLIDGTIIQKQDNISNIADYSSPIQNLELMDCSKDAFVNLEVIKSIEKADYIVIWPWDIYTSIVSNLIIWNIRDLLRESKAKIIYIWNNTNKWWETNGLRLLDFINIIERYISKKLDYVILNNYLPELSLEDKEKLTKNISVKWWEYVFLDRYDRYLIESKNTIIIEDDLLDRESLYKHNSLKIAKIIFDIIL